MPSFTFMLKAAAIALLSSHLAAAAPPAPPPPTPAWGRPTRLRDIALPTVSGSPLPATTLTLQYVALGRGIQNYSCASVGAKPASIGAIATLYDATSMAEWNLNMVNSVPGTAVRDPPPAAGGEYTLPPPANNLSILGHHFFALDGTPTFSLSSVGKLLYSTKNGDVTAPSGSPQGPDGSGAVDWLSVVAKTDYDASIGLGQVYRVETAGGSAPASCPSTDVISVQYSAEYWFYD